MTIFQGNMISLTPVSLGLLVLYWIRFFGWKRKEMPLTVPLLFTCLFLPKLNLLKISTLSTAGIRVDDLIALVLLGIAVFDKETWKNRYIRAGIGILLVLSVLNVLSVVSGRMQGYSNNVLFALLFILRRFEYFAFALAGIYAVRRLKDPYKVFLDEFTLMSLLHVVLGILQVLGKLTYVVSGSDHGNFFNGVAVSTFNGYYEYGQFLCFGCVLFLCDYLKRRKILSLAMIPVTLGMLVLSISRTSLLTGVLLIVLILIFPIRDRASKPRILLAGWGVIAALAGVTVLATGVLPLDIAGRFGSMDLGEYFTYWKELMGRGDFGGYLGRLVRNIEAYDAMAYYGFTERISDASSAARIYKWSAIMDGFRHAPLLGYGPGLTHTMDGNYFKLLAETGILGTAAWLGFYGYFMRVIWKLRQWSDMAKPLLWMMVSILINALLIDMFEASKPMEMIWLLVGGVIACSGFRKQQDKGLAE